MNIKMLEDFLSLLNDEKERITFVFALLDQMEMDISLENFKSENVDLKKNNYNDTVTEFLRKHRAMAETAYAYVEQKKADGADNNNINQQTDEMLKRMQEFFTSYEYQLKFIEDTPEDVKELGYFGYNDRIVKEKAELLEFFSVAQPFRAKSLIKNLKMKNKYYQEFMDSLQTEQEKINFIIVLIDNLSYREDNIYNNEDNEDNEHITTTITFIRNYNDLIEKAKELVSCYSHENEIEIDKMKIRFDEFKQ